MDDHERRQSSPLVSDSSGVITASLKIPVPGAGSGAGANSTQSFALNLDDADIPFIEDGTGYMTTDSGATQQMTIGDAKVEYRVIVCPKLFCTLKSIIMRA